MKNYSAPQLVEYGSLEELVLNANNVSSEDQAKPGHNAASTHGTGSES